ncbi:hypothetical protein VNI00_000392 [Paramarasmius palmivorus]|uniref:DUF6535 domain-containing protein n=1 Tax=Paramarasmius palmivorus TaxID=297713 RepID=A0AAW0EFB6_9AGAR
MINHEEMQDCGNTPPGNPANIPLPPSQNSSTDDLGDSRTPSADIPLPPSNPSNAAFSEQDPEKQKPKLSVAEAWENLMRAVNRHDEEMVKNWKEDIDTLLVFAGLFSAVVTAFVIESYQWLDEDPADTTVALLTQISKQLGNTSMPFEDLSSASTFQASSLSVRVNTFWFLSLILSLTSGLFALLGKQWLREHRRDVPTSSPGEALGLRQMRDRSLEIWGVPSFLAALPILLELALLLFFAGVIDLLWSLHRVPFIVVSIAVGVSAGLYLITTILPALTVIWGEYVDSRFWTNRKFGHIRVLPLRFVCPYKSPQARAVYALATRLYQMLRVDRWLGRSIRFPAWQDIDLQIVKRFDYGHDIPGLNETLKVYELAGLRWAVRTFQDSPAIIPSLQAILETIPSWTVMATVFQDWPSHMWTHVSFEDVERALKRDVVWPFGTNAYTTVSRSINIPDLLDSTLGVKLLFCHTYWREQVWYGTTEPLLLTVSRFSEDFPERIIGVRFWFPFPLAEMLWTHGDFYVRSRSMYLLRVYTDSWNAYPGPEEYKDERLAFITQLARHINRADGPLSEILKRRRGQAFLRHINNQIVSHALYNTSNHWDQQSRRGLMQEWRLAMQKAREVGSLPEDYFVPVPETADVEYEYSPLHLDSPAAFSEDTLFFNSRNNLPLVTDPVDTILQPTDG